LSNAFSPGVFAALSSQSVSFPAFGILLRQPSHIHAEEPVDGAACFFIDKFLFWIKDLRQVMSPVYRFSRYFLVYVVLPKFFLMFFGRREFRCPFIFHCFLMQLQFQTLSYIQWKR
jgi:hypothetical protein